MVSNIILFILSFVLILPIALAQSDQESVIGILRGLLGDLPGTCSEITGATCIYCLGYVKLLPLAFFFGLFYLTLNLGIKAFVKGSHLKDMPSIKVGIMLISLALTFFTLQSGLGSAISRLAGFNEFIAELLVLTGVVVVVFFFQRILNAFMNTPGVGTNPLLTIPFLVAALASVGVIISFAASFAGGSSPQFFFALASLLALAFAFAITQGGWRNLWGVLIVIMILLMLFVLRGEGSAPGVVPELFEPAKNFALGICA